MQRVFVRRYPHGTLAAHILGNVGEITEEQLKEPRYRGLQPGDEIGQDGVEDTYDRYLRGKPGLTRIQVDALGQPTPNGQLVSQPPVPGDNLKLTIDADVQEAGEAALAARGLRGGFITMDVHSGEILGLGSFPTFEPVGLHPADDPERRSTTLYRDPIAAPLTDRAIAGLYPTGSTFKPITAIAALESGNLTPSEVIDDPGQLVVGGQVFKNAGEAANGSVSLVSALEVSSDVFFYTLGLRMWDTGYLQHWAHALGIGRPTGIDLPGRRPKGLLPSQHWRNQLYKEGETERPWSAGDNVQLATGQGDLQTNPLQMAIAYAALANGGTVVTPHVGMEIDDAAGRVLKEFDPGPRRHVHIDPDLPGGDPRRPARRRAERRRHLVRRLRQLPDPGRRQDRDRRSGRRYADQSWYGVLAPYPNPRIVTFVTMEEGGFGAEAAAPAAKTDPRSVFRQAALAKRTPKQPKKGEG